MTLAASDNADPPHTTFFAPATERIGRSSNAIFILVTLLGFGSFFIWAGSTAIEEVTRADGRVIPTAQNQVVQHMEGGIISDILVHEGDLVKAGDVLVRVQNSFNLAEMQQIRVDLAAQTVRFARLDAEASGAETFNPPPIEGDRYPELIDNEAALFERRQANLDEQLAIFDDQAKQQRLGLVERQTRLTNIRQAYDLMQQQVTSLTGLVEQGAASRNTLLDRQSQLQDIRTQMDDLQFQIPQYESGLSELVRRRSEAQLQFRADAENDRGDAQIKIAKLKETITAMTDRSERTNVTAPISGRINRLLVSTVGGVVQPGQTLLQIVPSDASVSIEARVSPKDRGDIYPGLDSVIKISAYNYSVYGGLHGKIVEISPDALQDESGEPYFRVRVEASVQSFGPDQPVLPGMLAEVDVLTGSNTVLDYLLQPIRRISENALRQ
ncbi:HlyD family type I secretion periplasmic adaptor subunit [uncultured Devosia sp.]|uniref:HlyD family type I secretion periplasmic adaptor subunit n=1 Tax=uncultured Devosia sp. TaxID=211434 RepID=UPI0035CC3F55